MSKKVILVTGGQRSGKSGYAQRLALSLSPNPVYLATSRIWDEEFRKRVERHQRDRGPEWTNIEEEKYLSRHDLTDRVVVIDCVTLWGTNFFFDNQSDVELSLSLLKKGDFSLPFPYQYSTTIFSSKNKKLSLLSTSQHLSQ